MKIQFVDGPHDGGFMTFPDREQLAIRLLIPIPSRQGIPSFTPFLPLTPSQPEPTMCHVYVFEHGKYVFDGWEEVA